MSDSDKPFDPKEYVGRTVSDIVRIAKRLQDDAARDLEEAAQLYRLCLAHEGMNPFRRGTVTGLLWEVERLQGRHGCFFSEFGQDRWLFNNVFPDKRDGFFVEIGGYDGLTGSNCVFFEKFRDWTGLIVEASPKLVRRIRSTRAVEVVHAALADGDGTADFLQINDGYMQMSGLAKHYSPDSLEKVRSHPSHAEEIIPIPTISLETLLSSHKVTTVDYCSLDIEGGEMEVLENFDFDAFDISVFSIENNQGSEDREVATLLRSAGYDRVTILGVDEIWMRQ